MVARIAALVAAVAMIVAAVYARNRIDEHAVTARLVCSTELAEACTGLHASGVHITVEPAGVTFDRLVALAPEADPGVDGWLVAGPWPQMVDAERARRAESRLFTNTTAALASSPLVVTVETQRSVGVRATCKDPAPWSCVASLPAKTWRDLGANGKGQGKVDRTD